MSLKKILQAADQAVALEHAARFENTLREFVASPLEQRNEAAAAAESGASIPQPGNQLIAENLNALIRRIADRIGEGNRPAHSRAARHAQHAGP